VDVGKVATCKAIQKKIWSMIPRVLTFLKFYPVEPLILCAKPRVVHVWALTMVTVKAWYLCGFFLQMSSLYYRDLDTSYLEAAERKPASVFRTQIRLGFDFWQENRTQSMS